MISPVGQSVECPLRGMGGHGFDPIPRHTKSLNWCYLLLAWHSDLRGRASVRIMRLGVVSCQVSGPCYFSAAAL